MSWMLEKANDNNKTELTCLPQTLKKRNKKKGCIKEAHSPGHF